MDYVYQTFSDLHKFREISQSANAVNSLTVMVPENRQSETELRFSTIPLARAVIILKKL